MEERMKRPMHNNAGSVLAGLRFLFGVFFIMATITGIVSVQAAELHKSLLVLDSHIDIPLDYATDKNNDPGAYEVPLLVNLDAAERGGYGCAFLVAYTPQGALDLESTAKARLKFADNRLDGIERMCDTYSNRVALARSTEDVKRIRAEGRQAVAIGMENGYPIGEDISLIKHYYQRGVRYITLTHNGHNRISDSCNPLNKPYASGKNLDANSIRLLQDIYLAEARAAGPPEPLHGGLSKFGRQAVEEMNRLGIMVDISHTSPSTVEDVLECSTAPIIASHSCCRDLADNPRNLTDQQIKAIAALGGVVQITSVSSFVGFPDGRYEALDVLLEKLGVLEAGYMDLLELFENDRGAYDKISSRYHEAIAEIDSLYPWPGLSEFVDHIDHVVRVAGIKYVGIGSDFDGGGKLAGFAGPEDAPAVTSELQRRGYTEEQIRMIWGGNFMRVWGEVEEVARGMGKQ
jgi:membrane dipeptidase